MSNNSRPQVIKGRASIMDNFPIKKLGTDGPVFEASRRCGTDGRPIPLIFETSKRNADCPSQGKYCAISVHRESSQMKKCPVMLRKFHLFICVLLRVSASIMMCHNLLLDSTAVSVRLPEVSAETDSLITPSIKSNVMRGTPVNICMSKFYSEVLLTIASSMSRL